MPERRHKSRYQTKGISTKNGIDSDYASAISIYLSTNRAGEPQVSWLFGPAFFASAQILGFLNEDDKIDRLLRSIAETVLKLNMKDTHWIRIGAGPNDPQRKRNSDGAGAWRRDIDRHYHLHYWEISNTVEIANIVHHNDITIPE